MSTSKPRVLLYSDCPFFGGSENLLVTLLDGDLLSDEFDFVFTYRRNNLYEKELNQKISTKAPLRPLPIFTGATVLHRLRLRNCPRILYQALRKVGILIRVSGVAHLWNALVLYRTIRKVDPDICHINNGGYPAAETCLIAVWAARLAGVKRILFNVNSLAQARRFFFDRLIDNSIQNRVDLFITASQSARQRLCSTRGFPLEQVRVIPNTIGRKEGLHLMPGLLRTQLRIASSTFIFGSIGVLSARKGFKFLIQAVALIQNQLKDVKFIVIGEGEERFELEAMTVSLGLETSVVFIGYRNEILKWMADFDALILPSVGSEDLPYVVLEAMFLGKPVIGTRVAGIPEQIVDGETGFIVAPGDPAQLSERILWLRNSPEGARAMGIKGKERYHTLYSHRESLSSYRRTYQTLLQTEGRLL